MKPTNIFLIFTERLEDASICYMATGSVASMLYGIPRFTHDLDLVIELPAHQITAISNAFPLDAFYAPPEEVIQVESHRPISRMAMPPIRQLSCGTFGRKLIF